MCVLSRLSSSCWPPHSVCVYESFGVLMGVFVCFLGIEQSRIKLYINAIFTALLIAPCTFICLCVSECDGKMPASYLLRNTGHLVSCLGADYMGGISACWIMLGGIIIIKKNSTFNYLLKMKAELSLFPWRLILTCILVPRCYIHIDNAAPSDFHPVATFSAYPGSGVPSMSDSNAEDRTAIMLAFFIDFATTIPL